MENLFTVSYAPGSNWLMQGSKSTWTKEENKAFESALAIFDEETPNRWFHVADMIPGKSVLDVMNQYMELVADINDIEAGLVPIPGYLTSFKLKLADNQGLDMIKKKLSTRRSNQKRKKSAPWTEEEHRRFLMGLQKHGKGDWRTISHNFVISKTPTQVASHAQKYYLRQKSENKDKRRPSIHDITTVHLTDSAGNGKCPPSEKYNVRAPVQISHSMQQGPLGWDHSSSGTLMTFGSTDDGLFMAYPYQIVPQDAQLQRTDCVGDYIGALDSGFYIQPRRFQAA